MVDGPVQPSKKRFDSMSQRSGRPKSMVNVKTPKPLASDVRDRAGAGPLGSDRRATSPRAPSRRESRTTLCIVSPALTASVEYAATRNPSYSDSLPFDSASLNLSRAMRVSTETCEGQVNPGCCAQLHSRWGKSVSQPVRAPSRGACVVYHSAHVVYRADRVVCCTACVV